MKKFLTILGFLVLLAALILAFGCVYQAGQEAQKETITQTPAEEQEGGEEDESKIYVDPETGWNVYESIMENFIFKFKYPRDWKLERVTADQTIPHITSADYTTLEPYITEKGIGISITNLGDVGGKNLEAITISEVGPSSPLIEKKEIKIDGFYQGLIHTVEFTGDFPNNKYPNLIRILSRVGININGKGFLVGFSTGGDKRQENYQFFKTLLDKIEIIEN